MYQSRLPFLPERAHGITISARGTCNRCTNVTYPSSQQEGMEAKINATGTCNRCTKVACLSCQQKHMESEIRASGTCNRCTRVTCPSCQQERMEPEISAGGTCNPCTKVTCPSSQQERMQSQSVQEVHATNVPRSPALLAMRSCWKEGQVTLVHQLHVPPALIVIPRAIIGKKGG